MIKDGTEIVDDVYCSAGNQTDPKPNDKSRGCSMRKCPPRYEVTLPHLYIDVKGFLRLSHLFFQMVGWTVAALLEDVRFRWGKTTLCSLRSGECQRATSLCIYRNDSETFIL